MDPRQLETVVQFAKFLEVLAHPEELKSLISDSQEILAKQQEMLGAYTSKQKADLYLAEAEKKLVETKENIQKDEDKHQQEMKQASVAIQTLKQQAQEMLDEANKKMESIKNQETVANSFLKQAKEQFEQATQETRRLQDWQIKLQKQEQELQEKSNKLKQLLG